MPIIIDTNCLANVFERKSAKHHDFKPVLDWIISGKGLITYGGTKYFQELRKTPKYLKILRLLKDEKKVIVGDRATIDELEKVNKTVFPDDDFDDPHLPAIVVATKCMLICSEDMRSVKYVKESILYPKGIDVPAYYSSKRNIDLLCDKYVHDCNKPLIKISKKSQEVLSSNLENTLKKKKRATT